MDYPMTFDQLRQSLLVKGDESVHNWDEGWRWHLVNQCEILVKQLWQVGIEEVFLNGSFVTDKAHPNDVDGYFVVPSLDELFDIQSKLNDLDPYCCWTWDRRDRVYPDHYGQLHLPMWRYYNVELYPHCDGIFSGIKDEFGNNLQFPAAFRKTRANQPKGIIQIVKG
jgi:hypothetical protein